MSVSNRDFHDDSKPVQAGPIRIYARAADITDPVSWCNAGQLDFSRHRRRRIGNHFAIIHTISQEGE